MPMWRRLLSSFNLSTSDIDENRRRYTGPASGKLMGPVSREDVCQAFRFILGREPENDGVVEAHVRAAGNVADLRSSLINSEEFQGKYRSLHPGSKLNPYWSADRETLVFLHLQKTGGSSLRNMLLKHFPADRVCPMRDNNLHSYSVAELGQFDFFAGHFDLSSLNHIPRQTTKVVSLFREPISRLISFYRFARAHPPRDEFANDPTIRLANSLSAEEFFERPEMRCMTETYNHYVMALGLSCSWFECNAACPTRELMSDALERAKTAIRAMTAVGITEQFAESVEYILRACHVSSEQPIPSIHVTDKLPATDSRFNQVESVEVTPRLVAALEDLIVFDTKLYRFAVDEFQRRKCKDV
jgi:Sulfotransferase family